jgi:hypothetical protein
VTVGDLKIIEDRLVQRFEDMLKKMFGSVVPVPEDVIASKKKL